MNQRASPCPLRVVPPEPCHGDFDSRKARSRVPGSHVAAFSAACGFSTARPFSRLCCLLPVDGESSLRTPPSPAGQPGPLPAPSWPCASPEFLDQATTVTYVMRGILAPADSHTRLAHLSPAGSAFACAGVRREGVGDWEEAGVGGWMEKMLATSLHGQLTFKLNTHAAPLLPVRSTSESVNATISAV